MQAAEKKYEIDGYHQILLRSFCRRVALLLLLSVQSLTYLSSLNDTQCPVQGIAQQRHYWPQCLLLYLTKEKSSQDGETPKIVDLDRSLTPLSALHVIIWLTAQYSQQAYRLCPDMSADNDSDSLAQLL